MAGEGGGGCSYVEAKKSKPLEGTSRTYSKSTYQISTSWLCCRGEEGRDICEKLTPKMRKTTKHDFLGIVRRSSSAENSKLSKSIPRTPT